MTGIENHIILKQKLFHFKLWNNNIFHLKISDTFHNCAVFLLILDIGYVDFIVVERRTSQTKPQGDEKLYMIYFKNPLFVLFLFLLSTHKSKLLNCTI